MLFGLNNQCTGCVLIMLAQKWVIPVFEVFSHLSRCFSTNTNIRSSKKEPHKNMGQKGSKTTKSKRESTREDDSQNTPTSPRVQKNEGGEEDEMHPSWNDDVLFNEDNKK